MHAVTPVLQASQVVSSGARPDNLIQVSSFATHHCLFALSLSLPAATLACIECPLASTTPLFNPSLGQATAVKPRQSCILIVLFLSKIVAPHARLPRKDHGILEQITEDKNSLAAVNHTLRPARLVRRGPR